MATFYTGIDNHEVANAGVMLGDLQQEHFIRDDVNYTEGVVPAGTCLGKYTLGGKTYVRKFQNGDLYGGILNMSLKYDTIEHKDIAIKLKNTTSEESDVYGVRVRRSGGFYTDRLPNYTTQFLTASGGKFDGSNIITIQA